MSKYYSLFGSSFVSESYRHGAPSETLTSIKGLWKTSLLTDKVLRVTYLLFLEVPVIVDLVVNNKSVTGHLSTQIV